MAGNADGVAQCADVIHAATRYCKAHRLWLMIATLLFLIISNKEIPMTRSRKRFVARIVGFALVMTVAPVAFGSPADPGLQINNACARSGNCCVEMGSWCTGGGGLDFYTCVSF